MVDVEYEMIYVTVHLKADYLAIWLLLFKQSRMQFKPIKR